jgi:hypothetical protein
MGSIRRRLAIKWTEFWTPNLGYSVVAAMVTLILSVAPWVWSYNVYDRTAGLKSWANQQPLDRIMKFAHTFDQWLLIGLALAVAAGLNWFESFLDSRGKYDLGWQAGGATAFCFLGGLGTFFFGYISYAGSFEVFEQHVRYFDNELRIYLFATICIMLSYLISVMEVRRVKDRAGI